MKQKILAAVVTAALALGVVGARAIDTSQAETELKDLVTKVKAKLKDGKKAEAEFKDELKEFDTLLDKYKGEKDEAVARILVLKAALYQEVFNDEKKGNELLAKVVSDFPGTEAAKAAQESKVRADLVTGEKFPDFDVKDTAGKQVSVSNLKGKVVLVDFWATWCGPCRGEVPNVVKTYEKHHGAGFEIIGVSLDQDRSKLDDFTKTQKMTWRQYFDGKGWQNDLAKKYGVQSIPATFLLDREGKIIGKNLRGEDLEDAVTKALAAK